MNKIYSALLVPYDEEGNIYEKGLREVVRYNIDENKVDGLYVGGSSGENFMLAVDEKEKIFEIVYEETKGQVDLIAQIGSINLKEAKHLAEYAANIGYKTISAVTPFYYKFTFEEIKHYYFSILKDVDTDMIIYSIPALTGVNLTIDEFGELFSHPQIKGIKFTANDFYLLERVRTAFPDKLIYSGFDEMLLPAAAVGIDGAIGSTFNLNAKRAKQIITLVEEGKIEEAREVQKITNEFITEVLANGLYTTIKLVLTELGVDAKYGRQPVVYQADEKQIKVAKNIVEKYFK